MEQFTVPQFIDVEDKVIGPITVRQFIILLFGGGLIFISYRFSDFILFLIEFVIILALTLGLAFIKINGRPVHYFLLNLIQTSMRARLRIWQKIYSNSELKELLKAPAAKEAVSAPAKNKIRASRLAEMSLIVDTGGIYEGEREPGSKDLA